LFRLGIRRTTCAWRDGAALRVVVRSLEVDISPSRDTAPLALRKSEQGLHAPQVVRGGDELDEPVDAAKTTQLDLAERAAQSGPAEDLLHQLALLLAQSEAGATAFDLGQIVGPLRIRRLLGDSC
jgi:hypothetical protein